MHALSVHDNYISKVIFAAIFLFGICGSFVHAQEIKVRKRLDEVPPLFRQDTLTLCFMGDMMMHAKQLETAHRGGQEYDFRSYFRLIEDRIKSADIAVANMEFTLAGEPYSGYPCFSAPDSYACYLADCGFDVFLAANNHILDKGSEGAARTAGIYRELEKEKGIRFTGLAMDEEERERNHPLMMRRKGITLAMVNFTYGTNLGYTAHWPKTNYMGDRDGLLQVLKKSENADIVIVLPHWGPEYSLTHSASQEKTAEWLADNGADIIIGAHPHVVQDTASVQGIPVIYSLGNAVSNMSATNTQLELMVTLKIVRHWNGDIDMMRPEITWLWCSRPGGFGNDYTVIPVEEYIGTRDEWKGGWEYDKMVSTYERIRKQ